MDDLTLLGPARQVGPLFVTLQDILRDCLHLDLNTTKTKVVILQARHVPDLTVAMHPIYAECPELRDLPVVTEGFVCAGVPIGHPGFIDATMQQTITNLDAEFQKLLPFPYPQEFLLLLRKCCNQKILHLERAIGPWIQLYSQQFDHIIDMLFAKYFDINFAAHVDLAAIPTNLASFNHEQQIQLARVQLRGLPADSGFDLLSMIEVAFPAFYVAHLRHMRKLAEDGVPGPYFQPGGVSSTLFSDPFRCAYDALLQRGALPLVCDSDAPDPMPPDGQLLPNVSIFQQRDVASFLGPLSKTLPRATVQKSLTVWYRMHNPQRPHLARLRNANSFLDRRLSHLAPVIYKGPHQPLDIAPKAELKHRPNAFLATHIPYNDEGMSTYQMSLYLKLLLGLPLPLPLNGHCTCGQAQDYFGYHRLNCKHHAGKANRAAHDCVQLALAKELRRLDLKVVDNDHELRRQYSHLSSKKRGDLAVLATTSALNVHDPIARLYRDQFIVDVKMVSLVAGNGTWAPAYNVQRNKIENPGLDQQERIKINKHGPFYSPIGYSFLPFVASCFGSFGPTAVRSLFSLADLELRRHNDYRRQQGLDALEDPAARSQFRALCYRQISARIGNAVAKATVMRLLAIPRLPVPLPVDRTLLARNRPGPADSFSPSCPSSLSSLVYSSSLSPALSPSL